MSRTVQAAGGLLWRDRDRDRDGGSGRPEVALVHRPRYDDWSLPKGKLERGEHPMAAALREIEEETGSRATPGRPLGETHYVKDGQPKRVTYWAMRHRDGSFSPGSEVDRVDWVDPEDALTKVNPDHDRRIVAEFLRDPRPTRAAVVVRHASAGNRRTWTGADEDRPLDSLGQQQALGLVPLLLGYGIERAFSADVDRCLETLAPFARCIGVTVDSEPLFSETGYAAQPDAAADRLAGLLRVPVASACCTQAGALPDLVVQAARVLGGRARLGPVAKGALIVLHLVDLPRVDQPQVELLAVEQLPPPAPRSF